jgi:hypothetical protein
MTALARSITLLLVCLLLAPWGALHAQTEVTPEVSDGESAKRFGPDTIHYSVLNSRFLTAKVASAYGITRGDNKLLLNVAVRHQDDNGDRAIPAEITGTTSDLIYTTPLSFREIVEQDAIYYIAEFEISSDERRSFRLQVKTATRPQAYDIEFNKMLYRSDDN